MDKMQTKNWKKTGLSSVPFQNNVCTVSCVLFRFDMLQLNHNSHTRRMQAKTKVLLTRALEGSSNQFAALSKTQITPNQLMLQSWYQKNCLISG